MTTTEGGDDTFDCLDPRYWFYFLASSLIVFFAGIIIILLWRIIEHFAGSGGRTTAASGSSRTSSGSEKASIAAKIKWECEKVVSGQSNPGRIVVSSKSSVFHFYFFIGRSLMQLDLTIKLDFIVGCGGGGRIFLSSRRNNSSSSGV